MRHILFLSFIISLLFGSLNCNKSNPVGNNDPSSEIIPLKVGNTWVWQITNYDTSGTISSTTSDSLWVSQDTVLNGQKYFLLWEQQKNSDGTINQSASNYFARNIQSGYSRRDGNQETVLYNYPYQNGDTTVIASNVSVTVPTGTYNCLEYHIPVGSYFANGHLQTLMANFYICPNIGIVKKQVSSSIWLLTRVIFH